MNANRGWAQGKTKWIFWGLILNHFHFNLNFGASGVDLLPDFVGFILFYLAIDGLALNLPEYGRLKSMAIFFALIEGMVFVLALLGVRMGLSAWMVTASLLFSLLFAYFDYQLFTLVMDTAHAHQCMVRVESLTTVRMARLVCNLLSAAVDLLAYRLPLVVSLVAVAGIILAIWACIEVYGLCKELEE